MGLRQAEISGRVSPKKVKASERMKRELVKNRYLYFLAMPVLAYYIIFCYLPMFGVVIAFKVKRSITE